MHLAGAAVARRSTSNACATPSVANRYFSMAPECVGPTTLKWSARRDVGSAARTKHPNAMPRSLGRGLMTLNSDDRPSVHVIESSISDRI